MPQACRRCGQCCADVHLRAAPAQVAALNPHGEYVSLRMLLDYVGHWPVRTAHGWTEPVHHYKCRALVRLPDGTAACATYEARSRCCSGFPFYGRVPASTPSQYATCGYNRTDIHLTHETAPKGETRPNEH